MLDIKLLRNNLEQVVEALKIRGMKFDLAAYQNLEDGRKELQIKLQNLQNERNVLSKEIGQCKKQGLDATAKLQQVSNINEQLKQANQDFVQLEQDLNDLLYSIPNIPHSSVPIGKSEQDNVVVRTWGKIPEFNFSPKEHFEIMEVELGMDFSSAAKISGSRFVVLKNKIAKLHRALAQFMLDVHTQEHGYEEVYVPYLVNSAAMYGTGQLPKFAADQYAIVDQDLWLIPTAEVPLTNLLQDTIVSANELPLKYVAHTPCFRKEAGTYGKDAKGMFRQHQFDKVELVQMVFPENSYQALDELTSHAERILQLLKLPYRVVSLCSADLGFSAAKTFDLEVWLPGQNCYREISSCSNFEAFQARRLKARYKVDGKNQLLHTLNGSGVAIGRALIAVLENYQDKDGKVHIPEVLQKYI